MQCIFKLTFYTGDKRMKNPQELFAGLSEAGEAVRNGEPIPDSDIEIIFIKEQDA